MATRGLSHVGIAVPDLDSAIETFRRLLGCEPGPVLVNEAQGVRLVQFDLGNARIELLTPTRDGPIAAFIEKNPRGALHHVGLVDADIEACLAAYADDAIRALGPVTTNVFGRPFAFLRPADTGAVLVEIEQG